MTEDPKASSTVLLYEFTEHPNNPSFSPYCQKLENFLRFTNTPFRTVQASTASSPTRLFPYITLPNSPDPSEKIADSKWIIKTLVERGLSPDLDATLSTVDRARSLALRSWTDEFIIPIMAHRRFSLPQNNKGMYEMLNIVPWPIKPVLYWWFRLGVMKRLNHKVGGYTDVQRKDVLEEWVGAIAAILQESKGGWLFGSEPTLADVSVLAVCINALFVTIADAEFAKILQENLEGYVRRGCTRFYPEYDVEKLLEGSLRMNEN